jgi:myo-inositol-1(or 4)-monophosphatase
MNDDTADILAHVIEWARAGGEIARERFGSATASQKLDQTLVTDADHAVQDRILEAIATRYPGHAVLTEEAVRHPERHAAFAAADWWWVIDPIDGTRNYWRGVPSFAVSVGVLHRGQPAAGAVYAVMTDQLYSADLGGGAWCGQVQLRVADNPPTGDTLVGAPSGRGGVMPRTIHNWLDRMTLRNVGATAIHLALVAAGAIDAAFSHECKLWDVAAGALLVTEAGGRFTDLRGESYFPLTAERISLLTETPFLAAGPNLHRHLLDAWIQGS